HVGHLLTVRVFNEARHVVLIDLQTNSSLPIDRTLASHVQLFCVQSESLSTGPLSRGLSCGPLLRARRGRPCDRCAAEKRDELTPLHFRGHSMTSSARASNLSGIVKPSAFAVLKSSRQLGDELMPFWL